MGSGQGSFSPATAAPATTKQRGLTRLLPRSVSTDETALEALPLELVRKPRDTSCRHPYCLPPEVTLRCRRPPEQGHPHRCRRPPYGHGHHAACIHVPRSAPVTDVPRPGVQRLIALPAAAATPPSALVTPRLPLVRDSTALSPSPSRCCSSYFTPGTGPSLHQGGWSVGSWGI